MYSHSKHYIYSCLQSTCYLLFTHLLDKLFQFYAQASTFLIYCLFAFSLFICIYFYSHFTLLVINKPDNVQNFVFIRVLIALRCFWLFLRLCTRTTQTEHKTISRSDFCRKSIMSIIESDCSHGKIKSVLLTDGQMNKTESSNNQYLANMSNILANMRNYFFLLYCGQCVWHVTVQKGHFGNL